MLVYCVQMVGGLKVKLGMQVGLGPGHTVLDGDWGSRSPTERGTAAPPLTKFTGIGFDCVHIIRGPYLL